MNSECQTVVETWGPSIVEMIFLEFLSDQNHSNSTLGSLEQHNLLFPLCEIWRNYLIVVILWHQSHCVFCQIFRTPFLFIKIIFRNNGQWFAIWCLIGVSALFLSYQGWFSQFILQQLKGGSYYLPQLSFSTACLTPLVTPNLKDQISFYLLMLFRKPFFGNVILV